MLGAVRATGLPPHPHCVRGLILTRGSRLRGSLVQPVVIPRADVERTAIGGLRSFLNIEHVTDLLCQKHSVSIKDRHFVRLQAESIRYCLQQALEYRDAALASVFSRPTLVYYFVMSAALCEILFKRTGEFRLAKLRERHGHHGLDLLIDTPGALRGEVTMDDLSVQHRDTGTFPVWHETALSPGVFGTLTEIVGQGRTSGLREMAPPSVLTGLPARISLRELASCCPTIYSEAADLGIELRVARATLEYTRNLDAKTNTIDVIIHPTIPNVLDEIWKHITFSPRCVEHVQPKDFRAGGGFSLTFPDGVDYVNVKMPLSHMLEQRFCLLTTEEIALNEFGIYYLASYIEGMFARYYPEFWTRALDANNQTFQVIDTLMGSALARAPLLLLGALRERYYISD